MQVSVPGAVANVACRERSGLADRHLRVSLLGFEHRGAHRADRSRNSVGGLDEDRGVAIGRNPELHHAAETCLHPRLDVRHGRPERRVARPQCCAVHIAVLDGRRPDAVGVHQVVAARRLADGAVPERLRARDRYSAECERNERNPDQDRQPGMPGTPTSDRCDRSHRPPRSRRVHSTSPTNRRR